MMQGSCFHIFHISYFLMCKKGERTQKVDLWWSPLAQVLFFFVEREKYPGEKNINVSHPQVKFTGENYIIISLLYSLEEHESTQEESLAIIQSCTHT